MYINHDGFGFPMMMFGGLFALIFWVIIIIAVIYVIRRLTYKDDKHNAIAILKERFARGEINKEEYEERLSILRDSK